MLDSTRCCLMLFQQLSDELVFNSTPSSRRCRWLIESATHVSQNVYSYPASYVRACDASYATNQDQKTSK